MKKTKRICPKCNGKGYILGSVNYDNKTVTGECIYCKKTGMVSINKIDILDYLGTGKAEAKSRKQLCTELCITDRKIREFIHNARLNGVPIVNTGSGYYIADPESEEDMEELYVFISLMKSRVLDINNTINVLSSTWF